MPTVTFPITLPYRAVPNMRGQQPAAEVELFYGETSARAVGIFDSGSVMTVFSSQIATLLGITDVRSGRPERVTTFGGPVEFFMFDLDLRLTAAPDHRFAAQVGFFAAHAPRNILGRSVIFSAFDIAFSESSSELYLRPE